MTQDARLQSEGVALIRRMAGGDRQAFADFYDRYAGLAYTLIRRILPEAAEADEVLQDVLWEAWRDARAYDAQRGGPEAWLLTRARSRAIDRLRSIRRRGETFVTPAESGPAQDGVAADRSPASVVEERQLVDTALGRLPAPQRQVIELAFYGGLTQSEIALKLHEPLGTIKTRTRAALERLRDHFRATQQR